MSTKKAEDRIGSAQTETGQVEKMTEERLRTIFDQLLKGTEVDNFDPRIINFGSYPIQRRPNPNLILRAVTLDVDTAVYFTAEAAREILLREGQCPAEIGYLFLYAAQHRDEPVENYQIAALGSIWCEHEGDYWYPVLVRSEGRRSLSERDFRRQGLKKRIDRFLVTSVG